LFLLAGLLAAASFSWAGYLALAAILAFIFPAISLFALRSKCS